MNSSRLRLGAALIVIMAALGVSSCAITKIGGAPETTTFQLTGDVIDIRSDLGEVEVVPVPPTAGPDHEVRITRWFKAEKTPVTLMPNGPRRVRTGSGSAAPAPG